MKINLHKFFFEIYSFLFIFVMINREFLLFGLDLRYILLVLSVILLFLYGTSKNKNITIQNGKKNNNTIYIFLYLLLLWSLFSNISWLWNGLDRFFLQTLNHCILIANNLLAIIIFKKFQNYIDEYKLKKYVLFSCIVLVTSFVFVGMGYSLSQISGSDSRAISKTIVGSIEHKNLYGGDFRLAGYAEDANYASLFLTVGLITSIQTKCKKSIKALLCLIFTIAFGFSCSKTMLISFIIGLIYIFSYDAFKRKNIHNIINVLFIFIIIVSIIILPNLSLFSSKVTMSTRFKMWNLARDLFFKSPLIGNGLSSFKSYINSIYNGWYVQPHSTYWQLLSETGLIGFLIFIFLMIKCLNNDTLTKCNRYLLFIFFIFIINFETVQLQIFVYIIYILSIIDKKNVNGNMDRSG